MQAEIRQIERSFPADRTLLISDELFSGSAFYGFVNRGAIAKRLSEAIPNAEIILFLRNQTDLIVSLYNQYVKTGFFDKYLDSSFLHAPGNGLTLENWMHSDKRWNLNNRFINHLSLISTEYFRYSKISSLYAKLFKSAHIFLYEDFKSEPKSCLERLAAILSCNVPDELQIENLLSSTETLVNQGLDRDQLRFKLTHNRLLHASSFFSSQPGRAIAEAIARFLPDKREAGKEHVVQSLTVSNIWQDNWELNRALDLGMERYPQAYFGNLF
ncbi:MAG: sulfotransferase domain-containing protein [Cyanobacteria bacterium P01_D01_bin.123]